MNTVPENWIPFVPARLPGSERQVRLQRAAMPRVIRAARRSRRQQVVLALIALLVGVVAALVGYLTVRAIAHVETGVPIVSFSTPERTARG